MDTMCRIVRALEAPNQFDRWRSLPAFADIDNHPLSGAFARRYYPLVFGDSRQDESFAVVQGDEPKLIVLCTIGKDIADYYGQPIGFFGKTISDAGRSPEVSAAFSHLATLVGTNARVSIRHLTKDSVSIVGAACLDYGCVATHRFTGLCDLCLGEDGLRSALRKSYRSLVNWGRRNLRSAYVNADNPDRHAFNLYQDFHRQIAGRDTRPQSTWDAMFEWIAGGEGELILGWLESGELVAGTMAVDGATTTYYASGVYDRERFDKPMAHWPMHDAILRSAARKMKWFDIGDIPPEGSVSPKEYTIGLFKRGFASEIQDWVNWTGIGLHKRDGE